jgi:hypothetical protein
MPTILRFQPKQEQIGKLFYRKGIDVATWIGGGGSRAGGKSGGLRRIMLDRRQQRPMTHGVIIRRTWPDLERNHVQRYFLEFPELRNHWHEGKKKFTLPNGSEIHFMFAENQQEVDQKFWGPEFYDIMVDQAEQFSEQELITIKTCNRWPGAALGECKTGLFFNPGGVGTEFLRRVFAQKRFKDNEKAQDFEFVHLFGWDNYVWFESLGLTAKQFYALPDGLKKGEECKHGAQGDGAEYTCCRFHLFIYRTAEGRKLNALPPSLRAGHLLGSFDSFAGQYFAGVWDESKLILTRQQEETLIQSWWPRWMAHDDGFVHNASLGWAASGKVSAKLFKDVFGKEIHDSVEVVTIYRSHAEKESEETALVRKCIGAMTDQEKNRTQRYFLSVDAWEKNSTGHSTAERIAAELKRNGLPYCEQADNNRIGGWRLLYAMMKKTCDVMSGCMSPTREDDDWDNEGGGYSVKTPLLFISADCENLIESIPLLIRDTKHPGRAEDVLKTPTDADDDGDMLRYLCKSMLRAQQTAPLEVRAQEYYESLSPQADMTAKAVLMAKWKHQNAPKKGSPWAARQ